MEKGKDYMACFACPEFSKCNTGQNMYCLYNRETNQKELSDKHYKKEEK